MLELYSLRIMHEGKLKFSELYAHQGEEDEVRCFFAYRQIEAIGD